MRTSRSINKTAAKKAPAKKTTAITKKVNKKPIAKKVSKPAKKAPAKPKITSTQKKASKKNSKSDQKVISDQKQEASDDIKVKGNLKYGFDDKGKRIKNWNIKKLAVGQYLSETFYYKVTQIVYPDGDISV